MNPAVQPFIREIEVKEAGNGQMLYKIITNPVRLCPLGYFPSEELAIQALEDYLVANGKI